MLTYNSHILIVDDNKSIHKDILKVLSNTSSAMIEELGDIEESLFGDDNPLEVKKEEGYVIDHAYQGEEAFELVCKAEKNNDPYALIFMDVRMPPGMDGIETIARIWERYPYVEMVICTAFSDYTWDEIVDRLGDTDRLLFIKKPFDSITVKQLTVSLIKKWNLSNTARHYIKALEEEVFGRTSQLRKLLGEMEVKPVSGNNLSHGT